MMESLGYIALVAMGITLGLIGAGGSILTIPILVYLFKIPIVFATSYSLVLIGFTALIAAIRYRHQILFKKSLLFLVPSIISIFLIRKFVIPSLPNALGALSIEKALVILLLLLMGTAGYFMVKPSQSHHKTYAPKHQNIKVIFMGLILGIIMGLLGAGGGFLNVPTFVLLMGLTMQEAISTSLFIITVNSFIGFAADKQQFMFSDWVNLEKYLIPAIFGMLMGLLISKFIKGENLKKMFGYFIWLIGIAILIKEFIL